LHFLTETFIVGCFAVVMAVFMVRPVLSYFYDFIPTGVIFHLFSPGTLVFMLIMALGTSFLAGLYPAMVSSSYAPALSLKGDGGVRGGGKWLLRKGLIVFQFSISLIFIIGTLVIGSQMRYVLDTNDYGVKTDGILSVATPWRDSSTSKLMVFEEKIRQVPGVDKVIRQGPPPVGRVRGFTEISYMGKRPVNLKIRAYSGNEEFIPFYGMRLVAGRNLLRTDSLEELEINETCLKALGFTNPNDAVGQFLQINNKLLPIVGVVADFHENSFRDFIEPLVIGHSPENEKNLGIQLVSSRKQVAKAALTAIEKLYYQIYPSNVNDYSTAGFFYQILDEDIASYYETDQKTSKLVQAAMFVTIFISCLGLFGLALFTARKRTKEISIRKVIGASAANIFTLLTKDFVVLVLIAFLIASPIAWILTNKWLEGFAYRITISRWMFALAGFAAVLIALLTVSIQAIKAAVANPVNNLRTDL
jgi:ABC-type antimicrobial peptide transport system permease subunit